MRIAAWLGNLAGAAVVLWLVREMWLAHREGAIVPEAAGVQAARITVQGGYGPDAVFVAKGRPVRLDFTRREANPCSELVIFDGVNRRAELPPNETVSVEFTPQRAGRIAFGCHRGRLRGHVIVVD
jgi:plastocyanin domain-containing protein